MLKWQTRTSDETHADIASHEIELVDQTASSSKPAKHTCSGKWQEYSIPNLLPGTRYQASPLCGMMPTGLHALLMHAWYSCILER